MFKFSPMDLMTDFKVFKNIYIYYVFIFSEYYFYY